MRWCEATDEFYDALIKLVDKKVTHSEAALYALKLLVVTLASSPWWPGSFRTEVQVFC